MLNYRHVKSVISMDHKRFASKLMLNKTEKIYFFKIADF